MALDPIVVAAGIGVFVSPVAGSAVLRGLESAPQRWRRAITWLLVGGVVSMAIFGALLSEGRVKEGIFVFLLGALPGIFAFLALRSVFASAVVSLVPLYFGIGAQTLGRPLHTPEFALDRAVSAQPAWMLVYVLFLRCYPRDAVRESDRRLAPLRTLGVIGIFGIMVAGLWVLYKTRLVVL